MCVVSVIRMMQNSQNKISDGSTLGYDCELHQWV